MKNKVQMGRYGDANLFVEFPFQNVGFWSVLSQLLFVLLDAVDTVFPLFKFITFSGGTCTD